MAVDGRQAALDNALKQIEKDFGKGAIMRLGEAADKMNVVYIGLDNPISIKYIYFEE